MSAEPVNCGRCAHLANRARGHTGFGRCGCCARRETTGEIDPLVDLTGTCEFAKLSAKYDPDFLPALRAARYPHLANIPSILAPLPATPQPTESHERENEPNQPQDSFQD